LRSTFRVLYSLGIANAASRRKSCFQEPGEVIRFYNRRGITEQHIKEGKNAFHSARLSCKRFRDNELRLQLHTLSDELATFLRCISLPGAIAVCLVCASGRKAGSTSSTSCAPHWTSNTG
jgi:hypothetical protein